MFLLVEFKLPLKKINMLNLRLSRFLQNLRRHFSTV